MERKDREKAIKLIVRGDDFGSCHSVNVAIEKCFQEGILTCASLMVPPPWFLEAAEMCNAHPNWCIGLHLTLTSEWKNYMWKPVLPVTEVPSLVDDDGYFYPRGEDFWAACPCLEDIERELRAQVQLAIRKGVKPSYLEMHMAVDGGMPECQDLIQRIAEEYDLGYWRIPQNLESASIGYKQFYWVPAEEKPRALINILEGLGQGVTAFICHPGMETSEMKALRLRITGIGPENTPAHRGAVTRALIDPWVRKIVSERNIKLATYNDVFSRSNCSMFPR